jgi:acetylornithine deacetylase/succinyl-diaminopimelate desuccinylase-like protein
MHALHARRVVAEAGSTMTARALRYAGSPARRRRWLAELCRLLTFPSISTSPRHRPDLEATARWLCAHLATIGLERVALLTAPGAPPSVYAEWLHAPGQPTLLLYGHYDVQPVDPLGAWHSPPFQPTIVGHRVVARGASDDKGQCFAHLKGVESYLAAAGHLPINVKLWLEGEEEIGSPHVEQLLDRHAARLQADAVLVSDTQMLGRGRPSLTYGLRGLLTGDLEVRGPARDLHAGLYGGAVLNPLQALCEIVAGLHRDDGRVMVPGFYDRVRPPAPAERANLRKHGPDDRAVLRSVGAQAPWGEPGYSAFERMTLRPALTINGLSGGYAGPGSKSVIPRVARARLGLRLVPDQEPAEVASRLRQRIAALTPAGVRSRLTVVAAVPPVLVPRLDPVMTAAGRAIESTWGRLPAFVRSGGTIPAVGALHRRFSCPIVLLGLGLPDDRQHAPNEKLDLPTFFKGVETVIRLFAEYAGEYAA